MQQGSRGAQGGAPPRSPPVPPVYIMVSSRGGEADPQPPAYHEQRRERKGAPGGGAPPVGSGAGSLPPPLPPQDSQPWLLRGLLLVAGLAAIAAGVTLLVLWRTGVLWAGGGADDGWQPLAYSPRVRSNDATPAFAAELHAWLLPGEQAALGGGQQLDADVIIVGAGVAGLRAAQLLAPLMRVLVLEARVSGGQRERT